MSLSERVLAGKKGVSGCPKLGKKKTVRRDDHKKLVFGALERKRALRTKQKGGGGEEGEKESSEGCRHYKP